MEEFDQFWAAYPRRVDKGTARKAWARTASIRPLIADVLKAVEEAKRSAQWLKDDGQYIPYPATWLNGERWDDEHEVDLGSNVSGKAWYETSSGIEAKGRELGLKVGDYDNFPAFRAQVHSKAGFPLIEWERKRRSMGR